MFRRNIFLLFSFFCFLQKIGQTSLICGARTLSTDVLVSVFELPSYVFWVVGHMAEIIKQDLTDTTRFLYKEKRFYTVANLNF